MRKQVSVIVPCRNEAAFIGRCLDSILESDYTPLEVIVADGLSDDGTRAVVEARAAGDSRLRVIDNPERITPVAMNRAIAAASGEIIVRFDAHAVMPRDYISRTVELLESSGADNAGGVIRTVAQTSGPFSAAIVAALSSRFGVGNSAFRTNENERGARGADTVFGGCWRRKLFSGLGGFNEQLARSQDIEFNLRIARAGGKIMLDPEIVCDYYARADLASFVRHNFLNGVWAVLPFALSDIIPVRARHLIPLAFVVALAGSPMLPFPFSILVPAAYAAAGLAVSVEAASARRRPDFLATIPIAFLSLHLAYGLGSAWGCLELIALKLKSRAPKGAPHAPALRPDYSTVTEQPNQGATQLQLEMLATRYGWAAKHSLGKDVAEIACGAGLGLGWIAHAARLVQAGDLDDRNCRVAQETYEGRENIRISRIDALDLPFQDASLDLVLLFEAIYYLPDARAFFREAGRVLRPGGTLLIATVNCEWTGFNRSPFHTRYFSASDLRDLLASAGFAANFYAGFEDRRDWRDSLIAGVRRTAVSARLIPNTMAGKQFVKRLFYGSLARIPRELVPELIATQPLTPVCGAMQLSRYRTLYAEAKKIG